MNYRHSVLASAIVWSLAAMSGTTLGNASVSNLANPDLVTYADRATTDYSPRQAESFTTGSAAGVLVSITIFGANDAGSPTLFTPILFADAGGRPGSTIVETLLTYSYTGYTTPTPITFPAAGATSLLPNTTYWFSLLSDHVAVWYPTSSGTETSDYGWTLGDDHWSYGAPGLGSRRNLPAHAFGG